MTTGADQRRHGGDGTVAVVGVSHARSPAAVRERLHVAPDRAMALAHAVAGATHEAVVLSTCNRTELYLSGTDLADIRRRATPVLAALDQGAALTAIADARADVHAARHLFRVTAGLDAVVLGDTHVVAQVREAHRAARAAGASGPLLDRLFQSAIAASKRIRSQSSVSSGSASIPAAAIAVAAATAGPLSEQRVLVVGAGAVAELTALSASARGCRTIVVANRDIGRARAVARRVGGRATSLDGLGEELAVADIVVSATAAPGLLVTTGLVCPDGSRAQERSLLVIDLALPRDVDPALRSLAGVRLIDLDDLGRIVAARDASRRANLDRAEAIAREEAARYDAWRRSRTAAPAIVALRSGAEQARRTVLSRHAAALDRLGPDERGLVETITSQLVARLLHEPTLELRQLSFERDA